MKDSKRMTVEFSAETVELLEQLKEKLGKNTIADVLRLAIQVLAYFEKQKDLGYSIGVFREKKGDLKPEVVKEYEYSSR